MPVYNAAMLRRQAHWMLLLAVVLAVAVIPRLREQARFQWRLIPRPFLPIHITSRDLPQVDPVATWASGYIADAVPFVQRRFPDDPEMLIAASALTSDQATKMTLLERAVEIGGEPIHWAAYVDGLLATGPYYERLGTLGVDPASTRGMVEMADALAKSRVPQSLEPQAIVSLQRALNQWRATDPGNAIPDVVQTWILYGLKREGEARARWQDASRQPRATTYGNAWEHAVQRLLVRMGLPKPEAVVIATIPRTYPTITVLQKGAMIAYHEGRRAQEAGRGDEAVAWWNATMRLGRVFQECCGSFAEFNYGAGLEASGAAPVWRWIEDEVTGVSPSGNIMRGHFFFGRQHDFYARQVGQKGEAATRTALSAAKTHAIMVRQFSEMMSEPQWYTRGVELLVFGMLAAGFGLVLTAVVLVLSYFVRRGEEGVALRPWRYLLGMPALFVLAIAGGLVIALARECPVAPMRMPRSLDLAASIAAAGVVALVVPLAAAMLAPPTGLRRRRAWFVYTHDSLVVLLLLSVALYLGLGIGALGLRHHWLQQKAHRPSEMGRLRKVVGPAWDSPQTAPNAFIESHPPSSINR